MTEQDWLDGTHPYDMIYHKGCRSDRKRRLLACACARRVLRLAPSDAAFRTVIEVSERQADGLATADDLKTAKRAATKRHDALSETMSESAESAAQSACFTAEKEFMYFKMAIEEAQMAVAARRRSQWDAVLRREALAQCRLVVDVFGPLPFRRVVVDPAVLRWKDRTVPRLAQALYVDRRFEDLPVLADALEDAGLNDAEILRHCRRRGGVHCRGCWVLDLLTGRE
jgi:hypothetical protein